MSSTVPDSCRFKFVTCHCTQVAFAFNYFGGDSKREGQKEKVREREGKQKITEHITPQTHFYVVNVACFIPYSQWGAGGIKLLSASLAFQLKGQGKNVHLSNSGLIHQEDFSPPKIVSHILLSFKSPAVDSFTSYIWGSSGVLHSNSKIQYSLEQ